MWFYGTLLLGAFVGCLIPQLVFCCLFYPRQPVTIGYFRWQSFVSCLFKGLIADKVNYICSLHFVEEQLAVLDVQNIWDPLVDARIEGFLQGIKKQIPIAAILLSGDLAENLKAQAREEFHSMVPELKMQIAKRIAEQADLRVLAQCKLGSRIFDDGEAWLKKKIAPFFWLASALMASLGVLIAYFLYS